MSRHLISEFTARLKDAFSDKDLMQILAYDNKGGYTDKVFTYKKLKDSLVVAPKTMVYKAILSQPSPESGPVIASVIQDDFGLLADPVFTRVSKGVYTFPFPGVDQLTTLFTGQASITTFLTGRVQTDKRFNYGVTGVDSLFINTWDAFGSFEVIDSAFDGVNSYIHIEVKI